MRDTVDSGQKDFMRNKTPRARNDWSFSKATAVIPLLLLTLMLAPLALARMNFDFDPNLDFSAFKTFAYIGGVNSLEFRQLDPNLISNQVHAGVTKALTQRGLREVKPDQQPDLVVRYMANSQSTLVSAAVGDWVDYGPYATDYWAYTYDMMTAETSLDASLIIDLIDPKRKDLAWRLYLDQKITNDDTIWPKVIGQISKGFESYPPSPKQIAEKRKERAEHPPKPAAQ
jgi:hypothetical protein